MTDTPADFPTGLDSRQALEQTNQALAPLEEQCTGAFSEPLLPSVFLVEPGRSGSTLFMQLIINAFEIGYVSNLLAKFWLAPYLGAMLEQTVLADDMTLPYESRFGMMSGPYGTNEWGWFWQHWLKLGDGQYHVADESLLDGAGLRRELAAMESVRKRPILFDNVYASSNLPWVSRTLPRSVWVVLKRDPFFVCNSHLNARLKRYGSLPTYYGHRPRNYEDILRISNPVEQIAAQVKAVLGDIDSNIKSVDPGRVLTVDFSTLVKSPADVAAQFGMFLERNGCPVHRRDYTIPACFENRDSPGLVNAEYEAELRQYCKQYFNYC